MNMKNFFITTIIAFMAIAATAQTDKAKTILDDVSAKTKAYKTIKIDFTYTMENKGQKIDESFTGTLFSRGDSYKLLFSGQEVISDGKTVWTYLKDAAEVQVNDATNNDDSFTPTNLLSSYTKDFKPKLLSEDAKQYVIELTPTQKKNFVKVKVVIDKSKKILNSLSIFDKNGSTYTYSVNKFETDVPLKETMFTFKAADHPGVEVIDMR